MGGRVGWRIAAAYPERVAALGGFHVGGLVTDDDDSPHLSAGELAAEVYLGHADNDRSMTPEQIAELERALDAAGVRYRSELYAAPRTATRWPTRPPTTRLPRSDTSPSYSPCWTARWRADAAAAATGRPHAVRVASGGDSELTAGEDARTVPRPRRLGSAHDRTDDELPRRCVAREGRAFLVEAGR